MNVYRKVIETANDKTNQFPFSVAHLHETMNRGDLTSRQELLKFIFDISKFNAICPFTRVLDLEIENALFKSLSLPTIDIKKRVFDDDIGACFGMKGKIVSKNSIKPISEDIKTQIGQSLKDSTLMSSVLANGRMNLKGIQRDNELAQTLEKLRKAQYIHSDKSMRKNISDARFYTEVIQDRFLKIIQRLNISKEHIEHIFGDRASIEKFAKSIPSAYIFHTLNEVRNMNLSRLIEPHDLWDITSLAIAVPYCDIVVTEREWANILNEKGIGKLYNTKIIYNIEEIFTAPLTPNTPPSPEKPLGLFPTIN